MRQIKRKKAWDNTGVSEIIGTILMLSITVVLFSSIISWVGQLPPPRESFHVELEATLDPVNSSNWNDGVWLNIVHQGGQDMDGMLVSLYITVDTVTLERDINEGGIDVADDEWSFGDTWSLFINNTDVPSLEGPLPASVFKILIINNEKNAIIWTHTLGEADNHYAPIVMDAWIDSDLETVTVDDPGPISYTEPFKFYARIVDPEGFDDPVYGLNLTQGTMWVDLSSIGLSDRVNLTDIVNETAYPQYSGQDALQDDVYVAICDHPADTVSPGYYYFGVHAEDMAGEEVKRMVLFPVGLIVGDNPQIIVKTITFSDEEPVNGDTITIYANIWNQGLGGVMVNVSFYDVLNGNQLINTENITIPVEALGESDARVSWKASPGGVHVINVTAYVHVNETKVDPFPYDNYLEKPLTVMPKILLVDDDNAVNDRSSTDTVSFMRASLEAADFTYDFTVVGTGDGPGYDYGDNHLEEYDVVIWMTGYETSNTLTKTVATGDLTNLDLYLGSGAVNGGSLWLISQGFWNEATDPDLKNFAANELHIPNLPVWGATLPSELYGNETHPVTDYFANNSIDTEDKVTGVKWSWHWQETDVGADSRIALNASIDCYGVTYDSDEDAANPILDSRIYVQPWEFSRIKDTSVQAQYTYKVILWLGNITMKISKDVAISEQTVEPEVVFYKQKVTISFVIRNNGFSPYDKDNTSSPDLEFLLRITDIYGQKDLVTPYYGQVSLGTGLNNTVTVPYTWIPEEVGYHRLIIKVDPYDRIDESNELNNEISDFLSSGELDVKYRILVVDDDSSDSGGYGDETLEVTNALDMLNATGQYSYEIYTVNHMEDGPAYDGEDMSLDKYNAVLWVIGEDVDTPLRTNDQNNITDYLKIGGCLWLMGDGLWESGDTTNMFEQFHLRIESVTGDTGTPRTLNGPRDDAVSHGMLFSGSGGTNGDALVPMTEGVSFFYQNITSGTNNSVRYEGPPVVGSNATCKVATTAWLLSSLHDDENKTELVFMMLRWFDKPEDRAEARITNMDIWLSDEHPQLGSGYVIQATVHNTGGDTANVLVRFMDGDTQIGSDSISVTGGETTTAEIVWVPLFAGQRTLYVLVDPIAEVDEIFEWSNNIANKSIYVYFFWDDMEGGAGKWAHSSTIMLINGEEPLEYFYDIELDTDIITEWDEEMSIGINTIKDTGYYNTYDTAYWLQEPAGSMGKQYTGDFIYEFFLPRSGDNRDGFYAVAVEDSAVFNVSQADINGDWQRIYENQSIQKGEIARYILPDHYYLYQVVSNGPLLIVKTSLEGSNVNVANFDDSLEIGTNFTTLGTKVVVMTMQPDTNVNFRAYNDIATYNTAVTGGPDVTIDTHLENFGPLATEGSYYIYGFFSSTTPIWIQSDKDVMVFRISGDNDELDTAISNVGTSNGTVLYYPYVGDGHPPRILVYNSGPTPTTVRLTEITLSHSNPPLGASVVIKDNWVIPAFSGDTHGWVADDGVPNADVPPDPGNRATRTFKVEIIGGDITGIKATYGGVSGGKNDFDVEGDCGSSDDSYDIFGFYDVNNDWRVTAPLLIGNGQTDLHERSQHIQVGLASDITLDGVPLPLCDDTLTSNLLTYFSTMNVTIEYDTIGTVTDVQVAGVTGATVDMVAQTITLPKGQHDGDAGTTGLTITVSGSPTWCMGIREFRFQDSGSFAYQMREVATWDGIDYSQVKFLGPASGGIKHFWNFTSATPFIYIVDGDGNCWIHTMLPYEGSISWVSAGFEYGENETRSGGAIPQPLATTAYDYVGVTQAGPHDAWRCDVNQMPPTGGNLNSKIEAADADYIDISLSDNNRWQTQDPGGGDHMFIWSDIQVAENKASITQIDMTFEIQGDRNTDFQIWALNQATTTWGQIGTAVPAGADSDITITRNITANCDEYISGTGFLQWGCYQTDDSDDVRVDYIGVVITYTGGAGAPPTIVYTSPEAGEMNVSVNAKVTVAFSKEMDTGTVNYTCTPDPGGWGKSWSSANRVLTLTHSAFDTSTSYQVEITGSDTETQPLEVGNIPNPWSFTTWADATSVEDETVLGISPSVPNINKIAVTETMNLNDISSAKLTFWHKYNIMPGINGGFLQIGYNVSGTWMWKYAIPANAYTGNLRASVVVNDSFGTRIFWCWNGLSGGGTFDWDHVSMNLIPFVPKDYRDEVKIKFNYTQYGGGSGYGWYFDDVRVTVSRSDFDPILNTTQDIWNLTDMSASGLNAHSGSYSWSNVDPVTGEMKPGIDNYLVTSPIDLTNAQSAYLSAYLKFNLNKDSGAPPDGFRVEVTKNNGVTWQAINMGVRSSWGVSGTGQDSDDGNIDGRTYTGFTDSGNPAADGYWVNIDTLSRVNIDLSSYSGHAIQIRFRTVTCNDRFYEHNNNHNQADPLFGGFYIDDVIVKGETIMT